MRVEKLPSKMEYWHLLDDRWKVPAMIGIEHADGEVHGVMFNNPNDPKGVRILTGIELLGILKCIEQSEAKIKDFDIRLAFIS